MKQFRITILLTILMSMFGAKAFAHDIEVANKYGVTIYYKWINDNTELAVSYQGQYSDSYSNEYSGDVVIPESVEYEGKTYSVTSIGGSAFSGCSGLSSITIPNSVTTIGYAAFSGCSGLTSVTIPNSVTSIDNSAFYRCSGLTSVTIPNSVNSIGSNAFDNTAWYNNQPDGLVYAGKVAYRYKGEMPANTVITLEDGTLGITSYAFSGCSGLTSVTIPNSVTSIGNFAFYRCSGLTSVTIPNSVTSIVDCAFYECTSLTSVTIPNSVTSIGHDAFYGCTSLTSVTIPNSVTTIEDGAFYGCTSLTSVTIPNSVTSIGNRAFLGCTGLTSVTIPNSVTSIGNSAFYRCKGLTSVTIGNSVTSIGDNAFIGCSSLTSVTIPNSVTSIGDNAFVDCTGLTSVTIPNSVTSIGDYAFDGCSGLSKVEFHCDKIGKWFSGNESINEIITGKEVSSISDGAFSGCKNLTSVVIGSGVSSIGKDAFSNTNLKKTIWLTNTPPTGASYAQGAINYVANEEYNIDNKVVYPFLSSYFDVDGIRYVPVSLSDKTCDAIDCVHDESVENLQIASTVVYKGISMSVKKIQPYIGYGNKYIKSLNLCNNGYLGNYAFSNCSNMETADISNTGAIGQYAFDKCSKLKNLKLGSSVSGIGSYSYRGCSSLESVTIPDLVETIGQYAFSGCSVLKEVKLGSSVKTIDQFGFSDCESLLSITIPQAVTDIKNAVFYNCKSLKEVIIEDSETELNLGSNYSRTSSGYENPLFSSCPLDNVYIGRNIIYGTDKNSGYSPFYGNATLRAVKIADKETEISENEFYGCTNLQKVAIGDGVITIANRAFSSCSSLNVFTFGTQVATIGQEAFSDCTALSVIASKAQTPPTCGTQALDDINKWECKLYVPKDHKADYQAADQWKEFLFVEEGDYVITNEYTLTYMVDGVVYNTSKVAEGDAITPEPAPSKEGYTFSGWSEIPQTMPDHDVVVTGSFEIIGTDGPNKNIVDDSKPFKIGDETFYPLRDEVKEAIKNAIGPDIALTAEASNRFEVNEDGGLRFSKGGDLLIAMLDMKKDATAKFVFTGKLFGDSNMMRQKNSATRGTRSTGDMEIISNTDYEVIEAGHQVVTIKLEEMETIVNSISVKDPEETPASEVAKINIGKSGKASYCGDKSLDFSFSEEVKAYIATGFDKDEGIIWLTRVKDVPAGVPVLIKGEANKTYDVPVTNSQNSYYKNMFVGNTSGETVQITETDGVFVNYYLSGDGTFKSVNKSANIGNNKSYLQLPGTFAPAEAGTTQTVKVGSSGKASYAAPVDLDFTNVEGLKAFSATGYDKSSKTIWLTRVMKVQKGEGVLLKGDAKDYEIPSAAVQSSYMNMFVGNTSGAQTQVQETSEDGTLTNYYLKGDGTFVSVNNYVNIGNNKCYLALPTDMVATAATTRGEASYLLEEPEMIKMPILFRSLDSNGNGTTGLKEVKSGAAKSEEWFTLQGQRVLNPGKGLYIKNGRKVVIK